MEPLKVSKGNVQPTCSSPKQGGNVPIAVRFNAGDECIDEIFQPFVGGSNCCTTNENASGSGGGGGDSLSSSPSQPSASADEVNAKNFLQGNFFNRKRSGSVEGVSPTSSGPNLIAALSSGDAASVGTWKLIKGKVTQTIEEIKSSKSISSTTNSTTTFNSPTITLKDDTLTPSSSDIATDHDNATLNISSLQEDLSHDQDNTQQLHKNSQQHLTSHKFESTCPTRTDKGVDSDSDIDCELIVVDSVDIEGSRLRRGLANLKSKVKAKTSQSQTQASATATLSTSIASNAIAQAVKRDLSPIKTASTASSIRSTFLRKRRQQPVESAELATPTPANIPEITVCGESEKPHKVMVAKQKRGVIVGKKEIDIESGVEMHEDTIPTSSRITPTTNHTFFDYNEEMKLARNERGIDETIILEKKTTESMLHMAHASGKSQAIDISTSPKHMSQSSLHDIRYYTIYILSLLLENIPLLSFLAIVFVLLLPIPPFITGVLTCLFSIVFLDSVWTLLQYVVDRYLVTNPPERTQFQLPDYTKMPICEIPPIEEHKTIKSYSGWMNEVNSYDPNNFHISMSKSVYVKLEGSTLRVSATAARIPKKVMWNEPPIDRKSIVFTSHRIYNLSGCRVELLPIGLARKRYFNRKYPIQLIIKYGCIKDTATQTSDEHVLKQAQMSATTINDEADEFVDFKESKSLGGISLQANFNDTISDERFVDAESEMDFGSTIMNADLQELHKSVSQESDVKEIIIPCGDEARLLLFSRGDREKEDWYRRFVAASRGETHDRDLHLPDLKLVNDSDLQIAAAKAAQLLTDPYAKNKESGRSNEPTPSGSFTAMNDSDDTKTIASENLVGSTMLLDKEKLERSSSRLNVPSERESNEDQEELFDPEDMIDDETFEGLLMTSDAGRNPIDYIRFMALFQKACNETHIPYYKKRSSMPAGKHNKRHRRTKKQEDELWKGIDQSLFLGPSGSVVWANVLMGRVLYSCLNNPPLIVKVQDFLQKKLSAIKLPSFIEDVVITQIDLGNTPPLIHRISRPMLDERGTWLDADITYEGLLHITVTTKLNLLGLRRHGRPTITLDIPGTSPAIQIPTIPLVSDETQTRQSDNPSMDEMADALSGSAIYDSDAESSGGSSSESEAQPIGPNTDPHNAEYQPSYTAPGNARRIFKIVDRFTASNFFQYATELPYVQRAMENMNTNITLRIDLKGLVGRGTLNIPPPPSDRIWLSFRGPPRLWITAKPAVGDKSFDWSIVTNVIESKLCEEVNKYLVFPNMVDVYAPILGQPTYQE